MKYFDYASVAFLCFVISAKWAKELGYSQSRQFICALGGLLLGPLMPLILYVRAFYQTTASPSSPAPVRS